MIPTWNNLTQQTNEFVRQFKDWRDEIANYKNTMSTTVADAIKTSMLVNRPHGALRAHLLPNSNKAAKTVEDY
eukprot:5717349-Amphidinium_carterae.2